MTNLSRMRTFVLIVALAAAAFTPAFAQTVAPSPSASPSLSELARVRIDAMLSSGKADASWFSAVFLKQVTVDQIDAVIAQLKAGLGDYKNIEGADGDYTAHFTKGTDEVLVHLDADNKIDGLLFKPAKLSL